MKASELFRKYSKTTVLDHSNYRLIERIPAVPGTSNNRGFTVSRVHLIAMDLLNKCKIVQTMIRSADFFSNQLIWISVVGSISFKHYELQLF